MSDTPIYDSLTGAYTRALLHDQLHSEVERVRRYGQMCSLLLFDLDHFKSVNDAFGHARGDEVLVEVARRVRQTTRASDVFFRYGGDEFVVLLPNTAKAEATRLAERLLEAVRATPFGETVPLTLSLSIGVATCPMDAADEHALFEKADARNYAAKRRGRACVVAEDARSAPTLPFADSSRLIERDQALETAQHFFAALVPPQRGTLRVIGAAGTGRSRLLAELAKRARLQGFAVLSLQGTRALKSTPYGALAQALPDLPYTSPPRLDLETLAEALQAQLATATCDRLLLCVDDLPELDWGTRDLLRQLLATAAIPALGLVYTTDPNSARVAAPFSAALFEQVTLQPFSQTGLRVWLRVLMQWEPTADFIDWLEQQAHGVPAHVEQIMRHALKHGILIQDASSWQFNQPRPQIAGQTAWHWQQPPTPHNLPAALTSFIGREHELAEVRQLLAITRLLTLTGAGGMGKTRLSLEVAAMLLDDFKDGVWLIELASLSDATRLLYSVAAALGVREEHTRPLMTTIVDWLRPKQLLLVLDNCEHLVDVCAQFADQVLRASPDVRILASSREPLDIAGELVYRVPPLGIAHPKTHIPADELAHYPAARLFIERATFSQSTWSMTAANAPLIAQICQQLDGIPLAIELAAARMKAFELEEIAARLDDRFRLLSAGNRAALPRHQTLRALVDWSHDLLSEDERALLRWLAVFAGGWTIEAAAAVCSRLPADVLETLTQLVDKSLVVLDEQVAEPRYRMLETIRQYAREKLLEAGKSERLYNQHLEYYLSLAERTEPIVMSGERNAWVRRLETEHDNVRAALEWACTHDIERARRLAGALGWFWYFADHMNEGRAWHVRMLGLDAHSGPSYGLAKALGSAGMLSANLGNSDEARPWLEHSIALWHALGDQRQLAEPVFMLAYLLVQVGEDDRACVLFTENETALRESAAPLMLGWALSYWGRALMNASADYAASKALHDEALALGRAAHDPNIIGTALMNLGHWAVHQGDYTSAYLFHAEALDWRRQSGSQLHIAISTHNVADMLSMLGEYQAAQPLYAESLALSRALGDQAFIAWTSYRLGYLATQQGAYAQAALLFAESLNLYYRAPAEQELITSCLAGCAELLRARGQLAPAARVLGYVTAHPQSAQRLFVDSIDRIEYERSVSALREQLAAPVFDAEWGAGQTLTIEQAIEHTLNNHGAAR